MTENAKHTIHKLTLDLRFQDFDTSHKWIISTQAKTSEAVRRSVEKCLENYDDKNEYITVKRLELDLGVFGTDELLSKMPEKLFDELQKLLRSRPADNIHFENKEIVEVTPSDNLSVSEATEQKLSPFVINSEMDAFLFFLQHGYLPWWYSKDPAWDTNWIQQCSEENWVRFRLYFMNSPENDVYHDRALSRLVSQFSDEFLVSILSVLQVKVPVKKAWRWIKRFYEALQKTNYSHRDRTLPLISELRRHFWKQWIMYSVGTSAIPQLANFFELANQPSLINDFLSGIADDREWMSSLPNFWYSEIIILQRKVRKPKTEINLRSEFVKYAINEESKQADKEEIKETDKEDFIFVKDSGLILLHPFLPQLFKNCNWLKENEFLNDQARTSAISALHYLSTGDESNHEFVLMLPKVLCGVPLEWPLERPLPLTAFEKANCNEMLVQVIGHWPALRNASTTGLREAFLRRKGKLFLKDESCRLEVLRKTEDILLNQLTWGFSMIKFSWMPRLLSVSWE